MSPNEYLTSINELASLIEERAVTVIDTREPEDYAEGHIPGAISVYEIFTYLATPESGGYEGMRRFFAERFGMVGLCRQERVVIYEDAMDSGFGRSCRGWFILRHMGHKDVTVLHGGYQAWLDAGLPVSLEVPAPQPKTFPVEIDNSLILTAEEMRHAIDDPQAVILDCRDHVEWVGTSSSPYGVDFCPRRGRIPGAVWIEWYNVMRQEGHISWFRSPEELRAVFAQVGITPDSAVYLYCFKGARSSNMYVALKLAGVRHVRAYFAAWNEWSRDMSLPVEKGYPKTDGRSRRLQP